MRDGVLAAGLLFLAFGLLLANAPRPVRRAALGLTAVCACTIAVLGSPAVWNETAFLGCWVSIAITSVIVLASRPVGVVPLLALSTNTGVWAGLVASAGGRESGVVVALPVLLVCFPAAALLKTWGDFGVKVAASWLAAVAILAVTLPLISTASYEPDHMN